MAIHTDLLLHLGSAANNRAMNKSCVAGGALCLFILEMCFVQFVRYEQRVVV